MGSIGLPSRQASTMSPAVPPAEPPASLSQLYERHRLPLVRLAVLLVDDLATAEDVVQDAFAALHARWDRLRGEAAALQYVRVCVLNNARSTLRRRRTARLYVAAQSTSEPLVADEPRGIEHRAVEHRAVIDALRRLAPRQREVLVLRYWLDLSEVQIAETLGVSRGSVKSTASRALDILERLLEGTP